MQEVIKFVKEMKFKTKLMFLSSILLFIIAVFIGHSLGNNFYLSEENEKLKNQILISGQISELIHQLQIERGLSAGFLSSNAKRFVSELEIQRERTNTEYQTLLTQIQNVPNLDINYIFLLRKATELLSKLSENRTQINERFMQSLEQNYELINYYSMVIEAFLNDSLTTIRLINDSAILKESLAHIYFLYAKEKIGLERATLNQIFVKNEPIDDTLYNKFIALLAEQKLYLSLFESLTNLSILNIFNEHLNEQSFKDVEDFELLIKTKHNFGNYNIEPKFVFETISTKIEIFRKIDNIILTKLKQSINDNEENLNKEFYYLINLELIILTLLFAIWFLFIKILYKKNKLNLVYCE